jgi:cell wall-associated NlpC family hydrolase
MKLKTIQQTIVKIFLFLLAIVLTISITPPPSARAANNAVYENAYNIHRVLTYAAEYYNKENKKFPTLSRADFEILGLNPKYWTTLFDAPDCTNFVSQCLYDGGLPLSSDWKYKGGRDGFHPWTVAPDLYRYLLNLGYSSEKTLSNSYLIRPGDVVFFDWGIGEGISHAAICVKNDGKESYMAQHSPNREAQSFATYKSIYPKLTAYIVHMTDSSGLTEVTSSYKGKTIYLTSRRPATNGLKIITSPKATVSANPATAFTVTLNKFGEASFVTSSKQYLVTYIGTDSELSRIDRRFASVELSSNSANSEIDKSWSWSAFRIFKKGDYFFIQSQINGKWLQVADDKVSVKASAKEALEWERFKIEEVSSSSTPTPTPTPTTPTPTPQPTQPANPSSPNNVTNQQTGNSNSAEIINLQYEIKEGGLYFFWTPIYELIYEIHCVDSNGNDKVYLRFYHSNKYSNELSLGIIDKDYYWYLVVPETGSKSNTVFVRATKTSPTPVNNNENKGYTFVEPPAPQYSVNLDNVGLWWSATESEGYYLWRHDYSATNIEAFLAGQKLNSGYPIYSGSYTDYSIIAGEKYSYQLQSVKTASEYNYAGYGNSIEVTVPEQQNSATDSTASYYLPETAADNTDSYAVVFNYSLPSSWVDKADIIALYDRGVVPEYMTRNYFQTTTRLDFLRLAYLAIEAELGSAAELLLDRGIDDFSLEFTDIADEGKDRYCAVVLNRLGIIQGVGEDRFEPDRKITRQEAAAFLSRIHRFIQTGEVTPYTYKGSREAKYSDDHKIAEWAKSAIYNMRFIGVMQGVGNNKFDPQGSYTYEQSIVTFKRLLDY